jgi:mono/diheme cytochrome c family protein
MIGAVIAGIVVFAVGIFLLWVLLYASGVVRPRAGAEEVGPTGVDAMERKVLLATGMIIGTGLVLTIYGMVDDTRQARAAERQLDTSIKRGVEAYSTLCYSCHGTDGKGAVVPDSDPPRVAPQLNRDQFWADDPDQAKLQYDLVYKTIQRGRPGTPMPAWGQTDGGTLNQEQIYELTALIIHGDRMIDGHTAWERVKEHVDEAIAHGAPTPIPPEAAIQVPPELRAGSEAFTRNGCVACHSLSAERQNLVGPPLGGLGQRAGTRKPGMSAEDYIRESVRNPNAHIVEGFPGPPSLMPPFAPAQLPDDQLEQLVQFLMSR